MSDLLKAFDSYGELEQSPLFTFYFDTLSSELVFETPLKETKENMDKVLKTINLIPKEYHLLLKNWKTEDHSDSDFNEDYPYELFYKSNSKKCLVKITLNNETLKIEFSYDCNDIDLEKWILAKNHTLRRQFGSSKSPSFKVLTNSDSYFDTEEVKTEPTKLNITLNYNTDFSPVNDVISEAINSKKSGLILLHGIPGTGKTTYIKSLISTHNDSNFIFIQNEFINNLLDPGFISFLLKQRNSILVIEDAEKVITSREQMKNESVVSTLLQLTDGLFSDYLNIKVICTFNTHLSKIDTALMRKGRMIAMYEFKALSIEKTNKLLTSIGATEISDKELTIADIINHTKNNYKNKEDNKIGF